MRILTRTGLAGIFLCWALFAQTQPTTTTLQLNGPTVSCGDICTAEYGQPVLLTANVIYMNINGAPGSGTVAFYAGGTYGSPSPNSLPPVYIGSSPLNGDG